MSIFRSLECSASTASIVSVELSRPPVESEQLMAVAVRGAAMMAPSRVMPPLGKAAVPRSGSLADHENVAAKADEEQIARAVLAEGRDLAQRPRVGREILIPPRETRRREGLAGNEAREGHCPNIARNEVGEDILAL